MAQLNVDDKMELTKLAFAQRWRVSATMNKDESRSLESITV